MEMAENEEAEGAPLARVSCDVCGRPFVNVYLYPHGHKNFCGPDHESVACLGIGYEREKARAAAAESARDAAWREALEKQHYHCAETLDTVFANSRAPDKQYPFDHRCEHCAPWLALLASNASAAQPPPDSSAALLEARRLLGEAETVLSVYEQEGRLATDTLAGLFLPALRAFLGERSEHGKG